MRIASLTLGSPLISPNLNAQLRKSMRAQTIKRWVPLIGIGCVFLVFTQVFLGNRPLGVPSQQHVQAVVQHSVQEQQNHHIQPPTSPYGVDFPKTRDSPVAVRADFPPKIWQTWKIDPLHFEERDLNTARSWTDRNPDWRYEVLTDGNDMRYVEYHYGPEGFNRLDIVEFYRDVTLPIIKADLLRYLIMYAEGGVYADIDVEAMKPMSKFIPERYDHADINMVIGVEIDEMEFITHPILGPKSRSFCQWTFMCKPHLPVMMRLVEQIMVWLVEKASKQGVLVSDVQLEFDDVIAGTGPSAFTDAILNQMNEDRLLANPSSPDSENITWADFHDLDESKLMDHVLVLNVEAFAAGQGHSDSGTHDTRHSLVRHHYHASNWPSRHPRYKHPAYGQVEDCNWNRDCVAKWDADVHAYNQMGDEDKQRLIAEYDRRIADEELAEAQAIREEEDNRAREEDERRRADEERIRLEEEARKAEEETKARESMTVPPPAGGSVLYHWVGYMVFIGCVAYFISANRPERRQGPILPTSEMLKI